MTAGSSRPTVCQSATAGRAGWLVVVRSVGALQLAGAVGACQALDTAPSRGRGTRGTISGTVRGPEAAGPADRPNHRCRERRDWGDQERHDRHTPARLVPAEAREVPGGADLRAGESVVRQPGIIDVDRSDAGVQADIRPRHRPGLPPARSCLPHRRRPRIAHRLSPVPYTARVKKGTLNFFAGLAAKR